MGSLFVGISMMKRKTVMYSHTPDAKETEITSPARKNVWLFATNQNQHHQRPQILRKYAPTTLTPENATESSNALLSMLNPKTVALSFMEDVEEMETTSPRCLNAAQDASLLLRSHQHPPVKLILMSESVLEFSPDLHSTSRSMPAVPLLMEAVVEMQTISPLSKSAQANV